MLAGLQQASTVQHVKGLRQTYNVAWLLHLVRKVLGVRGHIHNTHHIKLGSQEALVADGLPDMRL